MKPARLEYSFGYARTTHLGKLSVVLPPREAIPARFFEDQDKFRLLCEGAFSEGLDLKKWKAKSYWDGAWPPGRRRIDKIAAIQHIQYLLELRGCEHDHKIAAAAYLMNAWLEEE